ncbi:extracellular solute-binding protein [Paenibacillus sp. J2TS4]|uniref:extracellular solute-binding protein n=1 Tax=Paenibacillus sp. J2TS4 TaxID=2807194 RepID=UPI001AFF826B|nr:extracellular solute-binding protein [Paenibacillus sp. J2TS4]GIP35477.1 sugar ABC transporter substrate-binding protein [Paenibacillus sp. J2TS4]
MKWKRSWLTLFLIVSVIAGCSDTDAPKESQGQSEGPINENFNETGLPIVNEPITLRIAGSYDARTGSNWNELETIKAINEGTNINIEWQLSPGSDWAEKRNLLLAASKDLPDVMLKVTTSDVVTYGSQGVFIPLEDLIDKYAPNLVHFLEQYPEVRNAITAPDGHIYSLPLANMAEYKRSDGNILWINTTWLEKVGMEMPTTTDEFREALRAFKAQGMEIPLTGIYNGGQYGFGFLYGSFGTLDQKFLVKDDKVEFVRATPEYKEVIKYLHSLYAEGLIDQEAFSLESQQMFSKLSAGEEATIGAFFGWSPDQITGVGYNWDYESPIAPLKGPDGQQASGYMNAQIDVGIFTITKANKHPEATMRWVDRAFEPEMSFMLRQGPNRVKKLPDNTYEIVPEPEGFSAGEWRVKETPYNSFVYGFTNEQQEQLDVTNLKEGRLDPDSPEWYELRKPYLEKWIYPQVLFTNEQYNGINRYQTDIGNYTDQTAGKWITTGGIEEEWEQYIKTLNQMGLEDYIGIYQQAYDTYMKNASK